MEEEARIRTLARPGRRRFSADQCAELAAQLLAHYPGASVSAVADSGRFVPMPAGVPVNGHRLITGHDTALDLVIPTDIVAVIEAWKSATTSGAGVAEVHPLENPAGRLAMYFIDIRAKYGVLLGVAVTPDSRALTSTRSPEDTLHPRLTLVRKNGLAEFVDVDPAFTRLLGYERADIVGRRNLDLVHPDEHERAIANWVDLLGRPGSVRQVRLRHRHADGHWVWFEVTNHNRLLDPAEECIVTEMIDVSEEMAAQEELRASRQLIARLSDVVPVGVFRLDRDRNVVHTNARAGEILGRPDTGPLAAVFADVAVDDLPALDEACSAVLDRGADADLELDVRHPRHGRLRCRLRLRPLTGDDDTLTGAIGSIEVTEPARSSRGAGRPYATASR